MNLCLDLSSLIDDFAAVKVRKPPFQIFNYILSNKKYQNASKHLFLQKCLVWLYTDW